MPILPFIIIAAVIFSVISNAKKEQAKQQAAQQRKTQSLFGVPTADTQAARQEAERRRMTAPQSAQPSSMESEMQRAARQAELKRRLQENAARRDSERRAAASTEGRPAEVRRPLEKRVMQTNLQKEKPTVTHTDDDCGGGSIHDGYHEGVTQFGAGRPPAVAGKLGHDLADEDDRRIAEAAAAENAKRAMARIAKLPPLAQGMIYSEILGKPKSETA